MTVRTMITVLSGALKRQWWIVALATLVAAGVGFVVAGETPTTYTARATISVDSSALTRFTGLTGPERLLQSTLTRPFIEAAAQKVDLDADELSEGLLTYTQGMAPIWFEVKYTASDPAEAQRVAAGVAEFVVEWQEELSRIDLGKQRDVVADTEKALAELKAQQMDTAWEQADWEFKVWNVQRDLTTNEAILRTMERVYVFDGATVLDENSGTRARAVTTIGAGLLGLLAGLGVAAIRERQFLAAA